jgi:hypothetical protein
MSTGKLVLSILFLLPLLGILGCATRHGRAKVLSSSNETKIVPEMIREFQGLKGRNDVAGVKEFQKRWGAVIDAMLDGGKSPLPSLAMIEIGAFLRHPKLGPYCISHIGFSRSMTQPYKELKSRSVLLDSYPCVMGLAALGDVSLPHIRRRITGSTTFLERRLFMIALGQIRTEAATEFAKGFLHYESALQTDFDARNEP